MDTKYHRMTNRNDLNEGEHKIEQFLTHPAVDHDIASSTQEDNGVHTLFYFSIFIEFNSFAIFVKFAIHLIIFS